MDVIEKKIGSRPKVKVVESWEPYIGGNKYQVKWDRLYNRKFNNTKISKYIDTSTFRDTFSALSSCLESFIQDSQFKKINWKSEALKDKLTGEWTNMMEIPSLKDKLMYFLTRVGMYQ